MLAEAEALLWQWQWCQPQFVLWCSQSCSAPLPLDPGCWSQPCHWEKPPGLLP